MLTTLRSGALRVEDALYAAANWLTDGAGMLMGRYWLGYALVSPIVLPLAIVAAAIGLLFHTAPVRAERREAQKDR